MTTFRFDSVQSAVSAVLLVLHYARSTDKDFTFTPLDADSVLTNGLTVAGDTAELESQLSALPGVLPDGPAG